MRGSKYSVFLDKITRNNFWHRHPLAWEVRGFGLAQFARDGRVGMFNLSWLLLGLLEPAITTEAYDKPAVVTAITKADSLVDGWTLEYHATYKPFAEFAEFIAKTDDFEHPEILQALRTALTKRLRHDLHSR